MSLDLDRWALPDDRNFEIIGEEADDYILENKSVQKLQLSKSLITDNHIPIVDNHLELNKGLYNHYIIKRVRKEEKERLESVFSEHFDLLFRNREIVLSKAEYYLLSPSFLSSGAMYLGGITYSLGSLFESFENDNQFVFEEPCRYKKMHLVRVAGSPLSGRFQILYWADEEKRIVSARPGDDCCLPMHIMNIISMFKEMVSPPEIILGYPGKAIDQLIAEIKEIGINDDDSYN